MIRFSLLFLLFTSLTFAAEIPDRYTELLDYVQPAPDQGDTDTCLFVSSTGAMELLLNKKNNLKHPVPFGPFDLSESFLINAPEVEWRGKFFWELAVLKFNLGYAVSEREWPFDAWENAQPNWQVWNYRDWSAMKKISVPKIETIPLFVVGSKWSTGVLTDAHVTAIKEALWKHKSPVLINYNDDGYWHAILIVAYDDHLPGDCYNTDETICRKTVGSFYVRDSFGIPVEVRDYDWFKAMGNAAFVVKEAP